MTNAWSFLSDELNMSNQDYWEEDGFSIVGNPLTGAASSDTISFSSTTSLGGATDTLSLYGSSGQDSLSFDLNLPTTNRYKYNEEEILKELSDYISGTYKQHYSAGDDAIQTLDLIEACGDGEAFCRSNILKYASRYDKKGTARRDIIKILHYALLLLHFSDKSSVTETYNQ